MIRGLKQAQLASVCLTLAACSSRSPARDDERERAHDAVAAADPNLLSSRGLYDDLVAGTPSAEALEFTPDYPLWSDGADKRRWLLLPKGAQIDTSDMDHWQFPVGTKFVKEFSLDGVRLETRVIERISDTGNIKKDLAMNVFVWNEDQTEAELRKDGVVDLMGTPHDVPRQKDCIVCHVGEDSGTLGFSAIQLSESGMLRVLERRGLLSDPPGRLFKLPGTDVERDAIGRLHANCGHCHTEGTIADVLRLRVLVREVDLPFSDWELYQTAVGQEVVKWSPRPEGFDIRIVPGNPDASALFYRMLQRDSDSTIGEQMPPLATEQVDEDAVAAVRAWIEALPPQAEPAPPDGSAPPADEAPSEQGSAPISQPPSSDPAADEPARESGEPLSSESM